MEGWNKGEACCNAIGNRSQWLCNQHVISLVRQEVEINQRMLRSSNINWKCVGKSMEILQMSRECPEYVSRVYVVSSPLHPHHSHIHPTQPHPPLIPTSKPSAVTLVMECQAPLHSCRNSGTTPKSACMNRRNGRQTSELKFAATSTSPTPNMTLGPPHAHGQPLVVSTPHQISLNSLIP